MNLYLSVINTHTEKYTFSTMIFRQKILCRFLNYSCKINNLLYNKCISIEICQKPKKYTLSILRLCSKITPFQILLLCQRKYLLPNYKLLRPVSRSVSYLSIAYVPHRNCPAKELAVCQT